MSYRRSKLVKMKIIPETSATRNGMLKVRGQSHSIKKCISSKDAIIRQWIGPATSDLAWRCNESGKGLAWRSGLKLQCLRNCHDSQLSRDVAFHA